MSIIRMKKVAVIGLDTVKEKLISDLMEAGVVQITDQGQRLTEDEGWKNLAVRDGDESRVTALDAEINRVSIALDTLERYSTAKSPLFFTRKAMEKSAFAETVKARQKLFDDVQEVLKRSEEMHKLREKINKRQADLAAVTPWVSYDLPLELTETRRTVAELGVVPSTANMDTLMKRVYDGRETVVLTEMGRDKDLIYLVVITMKEEQENVMTILKQHGFTPVPFAGWERVLSKLLKTKRTFNLEGWVPEPASDTVDKILSDSGCCYAYRDPKDGENVPVLTSNSSLVYPFESVMEMYSLPDYRGIDPTKYFALFYAMFFGYGLVIAIACFVVLRKFALEGMTYRMIKMFMYCGISTVFWGAMFGGWFGDFFQVAARTIFHKEITIQPLWFNPIEDPTRLLIWSLVFGVVHLFLGMGIKASMLIKRGQWKDAVFDVFSWYLVILGAAMWLAGGSLSEALVKPGMYMAIAGALILLLTGGRDRKGVGKIIGGLSSLYDVTGYISDILSYSRLLALGLATGVIATVVNTMGSLMGGGVAGTIVLLVVFVIGHTFNLAINALYRIFWKVL